jgi:hypothetical protein
MSNDLKQAAQQALEALELGYDSAKAEADQFHATMAGYKPHRHAAMDADVQKIAQAITALKAALEQQEQVVPYAVWRQGFDAVRKYKEQPEQEPVAWRFQSPLSEEGQWEYGKEPPVCSRWAVEPLYTHPPRREWRSLSEEEFGYIYVFSATHEEFACAIEAALRSKNHE